MALATRLVHTRFGGPLLFCGGLALSPLLVRLIRAITSRCEVAVRR